MKVYGTAVNANEFFHRIFDVAGFYSADLTNISGFGPQFVTFGLLGFGLALLMVVRPAEYHRPVFMIVLSGLALFLVFLATNYSSNANSYRILIAFPIIMITYCMVLMWRWGWLRIRFVSGAVNLMMLICISWSAVSMLPPSETNPMQLKAFMTADSSYRTTGTYTFYFLQRPDLYRILSMMPAQEPIAVLSTPLFNQFYRKGYSETWSYPYYDRYWQRRLVYFHDINDLTCNIEHLTCQPNPSLIDRLITQGLHLVSTCSTRKCARLIDKRFFEMTPGFYYFIGKQS